MKRTKTKFIILALVIISLLALVLFLWLNPKKAIKLALPNLNELSYVNARIDSDTAYISLIGVIENEAIYKISIDKIAYNMELGNTKLISEKQIVNIQQSPGSIDTVELIFRLPISQTQKCINKLQQKDSTILKLNIEITYNTVFGRTTFPFSKDIKIKVPTPPEIKLQKVKFGGINLKEKNVDLDLIILLKNNSEKIELRLNGLEYDAKLGENITGTGKYDELIVIKPLSTFTAILPMNVVYDKPFESFWKIVAKKETMPYEINMRGVLQNDTLQNIPLSFTSIGKTQLLK